MNLFDQLVTEALKNKPDLSALRIVVEKEILHHDILRIMSHHNLLKDLTFIGGTCLRACYGGIRLSEDLDFTGGGDFTRESLLTMGDILKGSLEEKYGLGVTVSDPVKDTKNADTWKIKIETRPDQKHLPAQRINIDICAVPSYEKRPLLLLNPYGIDMGTNGLIIQAQSREEIFTDKLLAFAFRPNRVKNRDLWDMVWLHQQGVKPRFDLIPNKLNDRHIDTGSFLDLFCERQKLLETNPNMEIEFQKEMARFFPLEQVNKIIKQENMWSFIVYLINDLGIQLHESLKQA